MTSRLLSRLPWLSFAVLVSFAALGCAATFGPAYVIEIQRIEVAYPAAASPGFASVRTSYRLQNVGTASIASFDVDLPDPEFFRMRGLQVQWSGKSVQPVAARDSKLRFHLPLSSNWQARGQNEMTIVYDIRPGSDLSATNPSANSPLFLPAGGWCPVLHPPGGLLASGGLAPRKWEIIVHVPATYVVLSSGRAHGRSQKNGTSEARFDQFDSGYLPFLVAGPFVHEDLRANSGVVSFWTSAPIPAARLHELAQRIESDTAFFRQEFGSRKNFSHDMKIIECPESAALPHRPWLATVGCIGVPGAVVVPTRFLAKAQSSPAAAPENQILESIDIQVAATWFYFTARTDTGADNNASLFPMIAAPDYAAFSLAVSSAPASRAESVRRLLDQLPSDVDSRREKPLTAIFRNAPSDVRDRAVLKSELFFIALEDRCGSLQLHRALSRIVRVLGGDTWGTGDLRSAVEAESGKDLGQFFRDWLNQPGIPADFRAKYENVFANVTR